MNAATSIREMATCLRVARLVQRYLDHEIGPGPARRVRAHLETCRRCGLDIAAYREIKASLAREDAAPDPGALARLRAFATSLEHPAGT